MADSAVFSEFVATRRVPPDAATRRWRRFGLAAAVVLHGSLIALLLTVRPWETSTPQEIVYDLVFVPPAAAPPSAAPREDALAPETPSVSPQPLSEPEPEPAPAPAVTTVPEPAPAPLPKRPVTPRPHRAPAPQAQPPARGTVESPSEFPGEPTSSATPSTAAVVAPPVAAPPAAAHPAPDPAYTNTLLTWLDRHKEYPWTARRRGVQGRVVLRLAVARSGAVTEARVESSSGAEILDAAAIEMVQRASPVPPLPASFPGDRAEFRVPVEFALSR